MEPHGIASPSDGSPDRLSHGVFHLPGRLGHFADNSNIPQNEPTMFRPSRIVTVLQKSLPQFCVLLSQQYPSSRNGEALMYNDSRIILQKALPNSREMSV